MNGSSLQAFACCGLLLFFFGISTASNDEPLLLLRPYVLKAERGGSVSAELGKLMVPENRRNPKSRKIQLTFVRLRSISAKPRSPIIYLAGGPGSSGIDAARGTRYPLFLALRKRADVIVLDQRGTGMSEPDLRCNEPLQFAFDRPHSRQDLLTAMKKTATDCADRLRKNGIDLAGYNTEESAEDIETLRKALSAPKISLWAISYGTHLALDIVRRHETSVDRMILAAVEGPDQTWKLPESIQAVLIEIDRMNAQKQKYGSLVQILKNILEDLEKHPHTFEYIDSQTGKPARASIGKFDVQLALSQSLSKASDLAYIRDAIVRMDSGDFSMILSRLMQLRSRGLGSAMPFAMDCASGVSAERAVKIREQSTKMVLGSAIDFPFPEICEAWKVPDLGSAFRSTLKSAVPALLISGTLDARCPPANAEEIGKYFSNRHHLIIRNAGHSDDLFLSSPLILEQMQKFLAGQTDLLSEIQAPDPF